MIYFKILFVDLRLRSVKKMRNGFFLEVSRFTMDPDFLNRLDDSQIVSFINSLSQLDEASQTSDPFNDSLDNVLVGITPTINGDVTLSHNTNNENEKRHVNPVPDDGDNYHDSYINSSRGDEFKGNNDLNGDYLQSKAINREAEGEDGPLDHDLQDEYHASDKTEAEEEEQEEDDEQDNGLEQHQFGDYGTYFHNKHIKQQEADNRYKQWEVELNVNQGRESYRKPIFKNCVIHVNGYTNPSINEIHRLVVIYGGKFLLFLNNKSAATHIVCDRLTPRKQIEFRNCKVVKAQWIVDCIESGELLDWKSYRLFKEIEHDQTRLSLAPHNAVENLNNEFVNHQFNEEFEMNDLEDDIDDDFDDMGEELDPEPEPDSEPDSEQEQEQEPFDLKNDRSDGNTDKGKIMDAKHPEFLKHFFANSRLHHLSIWKAELRLRFLKQILNTKPSMNLNSSANDRFIFHIDFDSFFTAASIQKHPNLDLFKDPIVVSHGNRTSDVASCNYPARKYGVKNGMWVRSALSLCPNLIILPYEFDIYEKSASAFYNYLQSRSAVFDTIFPVLIDEVLIDATTFCKGTGNDNERIGKLCQEIRQDIFDLTHCSVSIGVSTNILLAKLALRHAKPDGFFILDKDIEKFLDPISIKNLPGVGYSIVQKLILEFKLSNDPSIEELRRIPKERLMNVLGAKTGAKLYNYSRAIDDTSFSLDASNGTALLGRKSLSVDVNFGIRFDNNTQVETFLTEMAKEVSNRLIKLGLIGSQISLRLAKRAPDAPIDPPKYLGMGRCDFVNKSAKLGMPTNEWGIIASEVKSLGRIIGISPVELRGVAITISRLEDEGQVNRQRQMQLNFNNAVKNHKRLIDQKPIDSSKFIDPIENETIDWDMFDSLPWDIRRELKNELIKRNMFPRSKESTPKRSNQKSYMQQLLPRPDDSQAKFVRVIESPTKSPSKRSRSKTNLPQKRSAQQQQPDPEYELSASLDSSVLNELPSSLKDQVIQDVEYNKRLRIFKPETLKDKFSKVAKRDEMVNEPITSTWVESAKNVKFVKHPMFMRKVYMFSEMKQQLQGWVTMSIDQEGPHPDDVKEFVTYLQSILHQGNLTRAVLLVKVIKSQLEHYNCIQHMCNKASTEEIQALREWEGLLDNEFMNTINDYCNQHCIDVKW